MRASVRTCKARCTLGSERNVNERQREVSIFVTATLSDAARGIRRGMMTSA